MLKYCARLLPIVLVAGCGGPAAHVTDPGEPKLPDGYQAATDPTNGITVAFPPNWQPGQFPSGLQGMGLDQPNAEGEAAMPDANKESLDAINKSLSKMEAKQSEQEKKALLAEGIVLMFNDGSKPTPGEENTRFYVQIADDTRGLDDAADVFAKKLVLAKRTPVETPIGKCIRLNSDYTNKIGDKLHEIAYVWADGSKGYALRFVCTGDKGPIAAVAEPVMQTVRIRPPKA